MKETLIAGPDTVVANAMAEFEQFVERVYEQDPLDHSVISIDEVTWDDEQECLSLHYSGVPDGPEGDVSYGLTLAVIAKMISVRSRRRDHDSGELRAVPSGWDMKIRKHFNPMFDRSGQLEIGSGWFDLIVGMSDMLISQPIVQPPRFSQIKSKYAELRAYHASDVPLVEEIVLAAETISRSVCETCGAPGRIRGQGWLVGACDLHDPGRSK